uniref:Reticulon-like protein n=1 Tax=Steinernema glaseri TaxID=37863 RepID=A0A1I7Z5Q4_9BILA
MVSIQTGVDYLHGEIDTLLDRVSPTPPVSSDPVNLLLPETPEKTEDPPSEESEAAEAEDKPGVHFPSALSEPQRPFYGIHVRDEEPEETFERSGPLTIPAKAVSKNMEDVMVETIVNKSIAEVAEKALKPSEEQLKPSEEELEDEVKKPEEHEETPESKFVGLPRPPTPPKDMSDEEYQPSSLDLGPPPPTHSHLQAGSSEHPKSILKHSSSVDFGGLDTSLKELIYWRDPKKSAVALALLLLLLVFFANMSIISLVSYGGLLLLTPLFGYRLFTLAQARLKKTEDVNPYEPFLKQEISVPKERLHQCVDVLSSKLGLFATHARHLLLVEDFADSIKFGLILWAFSYIGSWFSGLALAFLAIVGVFTIPKFYEVYQPQVDTHIQAIHEHVQKMHAALAEKVPLLKQKTN